MRAVKGKTVSYFQTKRGTVGWPNPQARQIEKAAKAMGFGVDFHEAQTGTIYLELDAGGDVNYDPVKIRVADHGECYCSEDISCDPNGYSAHQTIQWIARRAGVEVPRRLLGAWKAAETRKANAVAARQAKHQERQTKMRELLANAEDITFATDGNPETNVPAGTPNRKLRIAAARQRIKDAYTILFRG